MQTWTAVHKQCKTFAIVCIIFRQKIDIQSTMLLTLTVIVLNLVIPVFGTDNDGK